MATTSATSDRPEREYANISPETALSPSISAASSHQSLCSSCFAWVSSFIPWHSVQSSSRASASNEKKEVGIAPSELSSADQPKSMASTSTTGHKQDNLEVNTGAYCKYAPPATVLASISNSKTSICTADLKGDNGVIMGALQENIPVASASSPQSDSMASVLSGSLKQKNKVNIDYFPSTSGSTRSTSADLFKHGSEVNTGSSHGNVSYATTSASESSSMSSASTPGPKTDNAFRGIASSPPATILPENKCFDVFLNHRGPDVKDNIASELHSILKKRKLSVFLDSKEFVYGEPLPATITAAMSSALIHIAIFSKGYAESPWCLAELTYMLTTGAPIIPIFYYVDPLDLKWITPEGSGKYVKAFNTHEKKGRYPDNLEEWKTALHNVSLYHGPIIRNDEDEKCLLERIVRRVSSLLENVPLVGLNEMVEDCRTRVECAGGDHDGVRILGIWGVGGSGKTTLAKEVYGRISSHFKGKSSIVINVRDGQLHKQQLKVLKNLDIRGVACDSEDRGIEILSSRLTSMKVFIVIDGVDKVEHLNALLPAKDRLGKGSVVIVTARTREVLQSWGVSSLYEMKLDRSDAKRIFCSGAFNKSCPPKGFDDLVEKFVDKCNGLPLRLKLLGRQLRGVRSTESWDSLLLEFPTLLLATIEKLPKASFDYLEYEDAEVDERLKVIYDALDHEEKEMFLDTACFFVKEEKNLAIEAWSGLGLKERILDGFHKLVNKNLVELDSDDCIRMNDTVQDFGRKISEKQTPYRLLPSQQTSSVENQEEQRIGIRGIMAITTQKRWNYLKGSKPFPITIDLNDTVNEIGVRCSHGQLTVTTNQETWSLATSSVGLNFFAIRGDHFYECMGAVSQELVWLRWSQIGKQKLPPQLHLKKLRVLELLEENKNNLEELWGELEEEAPDDLRELIISQCFKFQCFPRSIRRLHHLRKIVIIKSNRVKHLPDEFCQLQSLEYLVLYKCKELASLPTDFGRLRNLRHVCLSGCGVLTTLPFSFTNLINLEYLNLRGCYDLTNTSEFSEILNKLASFEID